MSAAWGFVKCSKRFRRDSRFQLGVCGMRIKLYPRFLLGEGDIRARRGFWFQPGELSVRVGQTRPPSFSSVSLA